MTSYDLIIRLEGEYVFLREGGYFTYSEPSQPGEELVGDLLLVALPYECSNCGHPEYAISEVIYRGAPPFAGLTGECNNCWQLSESDVIFDRVINTATYNELRVLDLDPDPNIVPLTLSDRDHAKEWLDRYP